ncbi:hypothetical protein PUATCC27989T_01016 [Phytobacter ursingii]|nr:hypothetical protein PUATCC27989T_01016 [Phytobacter ursingii]
MQKMTYEELEHRFQSYCKHDGGRTYDGGSMSICAICGWDTAKCQHRNSSKADKFCRDCGEPLNKKVV